MADEPAAARKTARPAFRPPKKRAVGRIALAVIVLAAIGVATWIRLRPLPVTTSDVARGTAIDAVYATGTVEARDRVVVKAKVAGSIAELAKREGDRVDKGDRLAEIDSPTLKYELLKGKAENWAASQQASAASPQLAALEMQMKATAADLQAAKDDRDRLEKLVSAGSATQADLDRANSKVNALEAQLAAQDAQRKSLKIDLLAKASGSTAAVGELAAKLADAEVRSPLFGVVLARYVELGEVVPLNGPLFKVGNVDDLVLECSVDEADIGRVTNGKKAAVAIYAFPKTAFHGSVVQVLPDADREKKAFLVKVKLDDAPAGMRSGMTAEVNLVVDEHPNALLAPAEAIDDHDDAWIVRDGRAHKIHTKTGVRDMLRVEVLEGLKEGDHLVVGGGDALKENARVAESFHVQSKETPQPKASTGSGGGLAP